MSNMTNTDAFVACVCVALLVQDLDDIEDENEQLKQENKTLLKVVGQLTR